MGFLLLLVLSAFVFYIKIFLIIHQGYSYCIVPSAILQIWLSHIVRLIRGKTLGVKYYQAPQASRFLPLSEASLDNVDLVDITLAV